VLSRFTDPKLVQICEELIKDRLRSPSTYQRREASQYDNLVSLEKAKEYIPDMTKTQERSISEGRSRPTRFEAFIKYEAANAYGTPVAGLSMCEYFSSSGTLEYANKTNVKIDGKTSTERLIDSLK